MQYDYKWLNKIDRRMNGQVWFQKGYDLFKRKGQIILSILDEWIIKTPTFLQKYRFCIIEDGDIILLDHDNPNETYYRYLYIDFVGRMAFNKEVKLLSYF